MQRLLWYGRKALSIQLKEAVGKYSWYRHQRIIPRALQLKGLFFENTLIMAFFKQNTGM